MSFIEPVKGDFEDKTSSNDTGKSKKPIITSTITQKKKLEGTLNIVLSQGSKVDTDNVRFYSNPFDPSFEQPKDNEPPAELDHQESAPSTANNGIPTINSSIWYWLNDQYVGKTQLERDMSESINEEDDDVGDDNIKPQQPTPYKVSILTRNNVLIYGIESAK